MYDIDDHASQQIRVRNRQPQRRSAALHSRHMVVQTENAAFAITPSIGLEAFEAGARVVKYVSCRVHGQWGQWFDRRRAPRAISVRCDRDVIAKFCAKRLHGGGCPNKSEGATLPPLDVHLPAGIARIWPLAGTDLVVARSSAASRRKSARKAHSRYSGTGAAGCS